MTLTDRCLQRIVTTPTEIATAQAFAEASVDTSSDHYAQTRSQTSIAKITRDIANGRVAELALYRALTEVGVTCTEPDATIYEGKARRGKAGKTMLSDLVANGDVCIAVKSATETSARRYGASWVLQRVDSLTYDYAKWLHRIALCLVADDQSWVDLRHFVLAKDVIKLYKPLQLDAHHVNGTKRMQAKVALYDDDLLALPDAVTQQPWIDLLSTASW